MGNAKAPGRSAARGAGIEFETVEASWVVAESELTDPMFDMSIMDIWDCVQPNCASKQTAFTPIRQRFGVSAHHRPRLAAQARPLDFWFVNSRQSRVLPRALGA